MISERNQNKIDTDDKDLLRKETDKNRFFKILNLKRNQITLQIKAVLKIRFYLRFRDSESILSV